MAAASRDRSRSPRPAQVPQMLQALKACVISLDRRADRWERCEKMIEEEVPWLSYERFSASDGSRMAIPETEVCHTWNTSRNAKYSDYDEWVFDKPGGPEDGTHWSWADRPSLSDDIWDFEEDAEDEKAATVTKKCTGEKCRLRLTRAARFENPGVDMRMSGGERGCAHSHRRVWEVAAARTYPTLILEDDAKFVFERSAEMGMFNGKLLTHRLHEAMTEAPSDFDVLYLGWSGFRGGNFRHFDEEDNGNTIRKAEYVWTTVAYVISAAGARKLLAVANPIDQPVDNFMAWEASQGRLKSYVIRDEGDEEDLWAGGICDQVDFQGDSDIKKSDGGSQGDDWKQFTVANASIKAASLECDVVQAQSSGA